MTMDKPLARGRRAAPGGAPTSKATKKFLSAARKLGDTATDAVTAPVKAAKEATAAPKKVRSALKAAYKKVT